MVFIKVLTILICLIIAYIPAYILKVGSHGEEGFWWENQLYIAYVSGFVPAALFAVFLFVWPY